MPRHPLHSRLIGERDRLFANIKGLYESFANAFIENYNPDDEANLKEYFRKTFVFPFNIQPGWCVDDADKFYDEDECYFYSDFFKLGM